jgi:lysophosphatidate acyltransferase
MRNLKLMLKVHLTNVIFEVQAHIQAHVQFLDIWHVIGKMTVIAKRELLYVGGTFGISAWLGGITYINRNAGGKAVQAINETVVELNKQNIKLWVFPEGTRRNTGEIHEFKKGAFHAAIHAQVPIVPVVFSSYKQFLDQKKKVFDKGEIIITALPEISTKGLTSKDVDGLIERTRNRMIETYKQTSAETSDDKSK